MEHVTFRAELGPESPFWDRDGAMLPCEHLRLNTDLCNELTAWVDRQWDLQDGTPQAIAWERHGKELYARVRDAVGNRYDLVWDND